MSLLRDRTLLPAALAALPLERRAVPAQSALCDLLAPILYFWLCCGAIGLALFPALRGADPLIGWWPFWLLLWPASSMVLLQLCRHRRSAAR